MSEHLKLPRLRGYLWTLGHFEYRQVGRNLTYDDRSYELIDEIFQIIKQVAPCNQYGNRELWLSASRGTIEDYGQIHDYEEMLEEGEITNREDYELLWLEDFPYETEWFQFVACEDEKIDYRAIFLGNRHVIEVDSRKKREHPYDISAFCQWLLESVQEAIDAIKAGTYNARLEAELPPQNRTGTIVRSKLYPYFPGEKSDFLDKLSEEEKTVFLQFADSDTTQRIPQMTAGDFFYLCSLGYEANKYDCNGLSPKEQYDKFADGRDEGLMELPLDDAEAFEAWYHGARGGGHPWEVCRGGNSTHVALYAHHDENGWHVSIAGSSFGRSAEAIKFFAAIHKTGFPVCIRDAEKLKERILGTELVGVVPEGVFPRYCHSYFEEDGCIDFMNLPYEDRDEIAALCVWQPLPQATLLPTKDEVTE